MSGVEMDALIYNGLQSVIPIKIISPIQCVFVHQPWSIEFPNSVRKVAATVQEENAFSGAETVYM